MYADCLFFWPLLWKKNHSYDRRQYTATATTTANTDTERRAALPPIYVLDGHIIIVVNVPIPMPMPIPPIMYEY